jgi:hypothetical protein
VLATATDQGNLSRRRVRHGTLDARDSPPLDPTLHACSICVVGYGHVERRASRDSRLRKRWRRNWRWSCNRKKFCTDFPVTFNTAF